MAIAQQPPKKAAARPPFFLLIAAAVLVGIAVVSAGPINNLESKTRADNVLLTGVPFILTFIGIVLTFIFFIWAVADRLNNRISQRAYGLVEAVIIGGVFFGVVGMFQPWHIAGYQIGFHLLLFSFISFNVWTHVTPKRIRRGED